MAADSSSDLARAANITALASMGKKSNRSSLVNKARVLYTHFLESLQTRLAHGSISRTPESLLVIVLLGIFEVCQHCVIIGLLLMTQQMISATEEHASNHATHSQGVYAMFCTAGTSLFNLSWAGCFRKALQPVVYVWWSAFVTYTALLIDAIDRQLLQPTFHTSAPKSGYVILKVFHRRSNNTDATFGQGNHCRGPSQYPANGKWIKRRFGELDSNATTQMAI